MRTVATLVFASLALPGLAAGPAAPPAPAHTGIELRTYADADRDGVGDPIRSGLDFADTLTVNGVAGALVAGPPMSPKQSCNLCHSYEKITSAYHFQMGLDERVDTDGDGFKDDLGQVLAGPGGPLASLPTLLNVSSPGQFGAW
ncbi:MAG: hypothetical protein ACYDA8_01990 [Deferrisomatales bacterium]